MESIIPGIIALAVSATVALTLGYFAARESLRAQPEENKQP